MGERIVVAERGKLNCGNKHSARSRCAAARIRARTWNGVTRREQVVALPERRVHSN